MGNARTWWSRWLCVCGVIVAGCAAEPGDLGRDPGSASQALLAVDAGTGGGGDHPSGPFGGLIGPPVLSMVGMNGLGMRTLAEAALTRNDEAKRRLADTPLSQAFATGENPSFDGELRAALTDEASMAVLRYLIECALPVDQKVVVYPSKESLLDEQAVTGAYGFWPRWLDEPCDVTCRAWVSACVFSRINEREIKTLISPRVPAADEVDRALYETPKLVKDMFPFYETSFFGSYWSTVVEPAPGAGSPECTCLASCEKELDGSGRPADACVGLCKLESADRCRDTPHPAMVRSRLGDDDRVRLAETAARRPIGEHLPCAKVVLGS